MILKERQGATRVYQYVTYDDVLDLYNKGGITFDIPQYTKRRYSHLNENFEKDFKRMLEIKIEINEKYNDRDDVIMFCKDFNSPMLWLGDTYYKDPITGNSHGWTYLNPETDTVSIHHYDTKEKFVTNDYILPDDHYTIDVDIPSGELVFGYYSVFEIFQNEDKQREIDADWFDSERQRKLFLEHYTKEGIAMWYDGNFSLHQEKENSNEVLIFSNTCQIDYPNKISDIEHDKCTCFCDLQNLLSKVSGHTFKNSDYETVPFTEENMRKEANVDSQFKEFDIIQVPKGKYRITVLNTPERFYEENTPEEMKEYSDNLLYTVDGKIELIEKY